LHHQFTRWAAADKVLGCADDGMSLGELLLALKEARVLDERCTAREVTRLFPISLNVYVECIDKRCIR